MQMVWPIFASGIIYLFCPNWRGMPTQLARIRWANVGNGWHRRRQYFNVVPTLKCQHCYNVGKSMLDQRSKYSQWSANVCTTSDNSCCASVGKSMLDQRWTNIEHTPSNEKKTNVGQTLYIQRPPEGMEGCMERYWPPAPLFVPIMGH